MACRGTGRDKRRDEQTSPTESCSTDKSPLKRPKIGGGRSGRATPFVSKLTGKKFYYDAETHDSYTYIKAIPLSKTKFPPNAFPYLKGRVKSFSTEIHEILYSPECIVVSFTIDANNILAYGKFLKRGKHLVQETDFYLQVFQEQMVDILVNDYNYSFEARPESPGFNENLTSSESSDSEQEVAPIAQNHSKPTISDIAANSPRSASTPVDIDMPEDIQSPEQQPAQPETPSRETLSTRSEQNKQQQQQRKRRARARFVRVDFSKLEVVVQKRDFLTILFRPSNPDDSFKKENPYKITEALTKLGGIPLHTRDIRDGGLAADFDPATPPEPLLQASLLLGKPVSASLPKVTNSCSGVLTGVHWEITEYQISAYLRTVPPLPILAVKRLAKPGQQSWTVKVTFQGTVLPPRAYLEGRSHKIRPYESKPLQCFNCGRFSHTARVCRSKTNCWTCSEPHPTKECTNKAAPKCGNCGGPHPADHASCPTRGFQAKVCQVKATENIPFRTARDAVSMAAKSYATAVSSKPVQKEQRSAATPNVIPNVAHPRPPQQQQQPDLTVLFNGLIAILTAAASRKDFSGALTEVLTLFNANSPNPGQFQLPG